MSALADFFFELATDLVVLGWMTPLLSLGLLLSQGLKKEHFCC